MLIHLSYNQRLYSLLEDKTMLWSHIISITVESCYPGLRVLIILAMYCMKMIWWDMMYDQSMPNLLNHPWMHRKYSPILSLNKLWGSVKNIVVPSMAAICWTLDKKRERLFLPVGGQAVNCHGIYHACPGFICCKKYCCCLALNHSFYFIVFASLLENKLRMVQHQPLLGFDLVQNLLSRIFQYLKVKFTPQKY